MEVMSLPTTLTLRVAARHQAGLLYPPPAMFRDIYDWVLAVVAATGIANRGEREPTDFSRYDPVLKAAEAYRANPTNWKLYVALNEAMWIFGATSRASVKDFQKMTPEKQQVLVERAEKLWEHVQERVQETKDYSAKIDREQEAEVAKLRQYLLPGVTAIEGNTTERQFPIDLTGWKYGDEEIHERVEEIARKHKDQAREMYEEQSVREVAEDFKEYKQQLLESLQKQMTDSGWKAINVVLTLDQISGARAYWQAITRKIVITVPKSARPYELPGLASLLRHEMQHFSQSYLAYTLGKFEPVGLPSKKIQTPEYKQWMSPTHPMHSPEDARVKELYRRLKQEGISPQRVNFHDLDDVEFYTELVDAIDEFQASWSHAPEGPKNIAVKLFTGVIPEPRSQDKDWYQQMEALGGYDFAKHFTRVNRAFLAWKAQAPGKYQKALKEFVKAVGQSH